MNNFYKALDYFRKLYRSGNQSTAIIDKGDFYWLMDGYTVHKIPKNGMELNPAIFKPYPDPEQMDKIVKKAESGVCLKETGLIKREPHTYSLIPFVSDSGITSSSEKAFTIWFRKQLLDTFQPEISLCGTGSSDPAAVKESGETIGIIFPVRSPKEDITPFI